MTITKKQLAKMIRDLRREQGWTQEEFGQKMTPPVAGATVSRWENGHHVPQPEHLRAIADLRGEAPGRFLRRVEEALEDSEIRDRAQVLRDEVDEVEEGPVRIGDYRVELLPDGSLLIDEQVVVYLM